MEKTTNDNKKERRKLAVKKYNDKRYKTDEYKTWFKDYIKKDNRKKTLKKYRQSEKNKISQRKYTKKRIKTDIGFKLGFYLRNRLRKAIKCGYKSGSAISDLGCSIEFFIEYFKTLFTEGMSWDNYGKWEIDHIKPLSLFNLENREELLIACNYKNLQPLWREDNRLKSNNYDDNDHFIKETKYTSVISDTPKVTVTIT